MAAPLPIAITYTDFTLTLLQLVRRGKTYRVRSHAHIPLTEGIIENGEVRNPDEFGQAISQGLEEGAPEAFTGKQVVLRIPERHTFIRLLTLPKEDSIALGERIPWAVDEEVPLPIEKLTYDWSLMKEDEKTSLVQVAAVPMRMVEPALEALQAADVFPVAIEPSTPALLRAVQANAESRKDIPAFYMDVSASEATFALFLPPALSFTSSIPVPFSKMAEALASALEIPKEKAMAFLQTGIGGDWDEETALRTIQPFLDRLSMEITKVLSYAQTHLDVPVNISEIDMTGPLTNLDGVASYLALKVRKPIRLLEVAETLPLVSSDAFDESQARAFAIPLGLGTWDEKARKDDALSSSDPFPSFNLLPNSLRKQRTLLKIRRFVIYSSIAIVAAMLLFQGFLFGLQSAIDTTIEARKAEVAPSIAGAQDETTMEIEALVDRVNTLAVRSEQIASNRARWTPFLIDLAEAAPDGVQLTSVRISTAPDGVSLDGIADTREDFLTFKAALDDMSVLSSVVSPASNLTLSENVAFSLSGTIDIDVLSVPAAVPTDQ